MTTVVTRAVKGSALTYAEMDANFNNLNTDKLEAGTPGTNIANTPAGGVVATTVQAAIDELDTKKAPLASPVFTGNPTAPTPAAGDNDTSIATTAFVNSLIVGKNKIINGSFNVWQRGTSFAGITNGSYSADRWRIQFDGSGTHNTSRTDRRIETGKYAFNFYQSIAGSGATYRVIQQKIEGCNTLAGKTATVSFRAMLVSGSGTDFTISVIRNYGTGGSPSVQETIGTSGTKTLTGAFQTFSYTVAIPALTGKTIGTNGDHCLDIRVNLPLNAINEVEFQDFKVEEGSIVTPFEDRPAELELALCQRYYYRIVPLINDTYGVAFSTVTNTTGRAFIPFPVTMRTAPGALEQSGTAAHYGISIANIGTICGAVPIIAAPTSNKGAEVEWSAGSGHTAGQAGTFFAVSASGYLGWSAEL